MKNGYIKTAAATPYITVADCNANGSEIIRLIHEMEKEHVKVMTFPELCITGYTCQDLFLQRRLLDSAWETLLKITKETADVDALVFVGAVGIAVRAIAPTAKARHRTLPLWCWTSAAALPCPSSQATWAVPTTLPGRLPLCAVRCR